LWQKAFNVQPGVHTIFYIKPTNKATELWDCKWREMRRFPCLVMSAEDWNDFSIYFWGQPQDVSFPLTDWQISEVLRDSSASKANEQSVR